MDVFGISITIVLLGVIGYLWKFRKGITKMIPGKIDGEVLDILEGAANHLEMDVDDLAKDSRGKLKEKIKDKWL